MSVPGTPTVTMPVYYSAQADAHQGYSIYRLTNGKEVRATSVNGTTQWEDEVYVGETPGSGGWVSSHKRDFPMLMIPRPTKVHGHPMTWPAMGKRR